MPIKIIGVTGPSGSGKTMLCKFFEKQNIPAIYADALYHSMLVPPSDCLSAIRRVFGEAVFRTDGTLDRKKLGGIVFSDPEKLEILNKTVLSYVIAEIRRIVSDYEKAGHGIVIVDAPTLIESGFDTECAAVIAVLADKNKRIERIWARDGITEGEAEKRASAQKDDTFYVSAADFIFHNDGDPSLFEENAAALLGKLGGFLNE